MTNNVDIRDETEMQIRLRFAGEDVRAGAAADNADVERGSAEEVVDWPRSRAKIRQDVEQPVDRRRAPLGIGGVAAGAAAAKGRA